MRVALDVDGVLADFTGATLSWIRAALGIHLKYEDMERYDIDSYVPEDQRQRLFNAWNAEHFCTMIPVVGAQMDDAGLRGRTEKAVASLRANHTVKCLTSPMKTSMHWIAERSHWLKYIFGFEFEDVIYAHAKHEHHEEFDILIDDKPENVRDWMLKTGKPAILINQPWNRNAHLPYRANDLWDAIYLIDKLTPKNVP